MLPFQRIAVTEPPAGWFHGITGALFDLYRQALVDLGLAVFDVPVDAFFPPDSTRIAKLMSDLRSFRPEVALGLSHGLHAMICRLPAGRDGWRPNFFTEVLDLPTICLWDHAPLDLADQLLPHPASPEQSAPGVMETLRQTLRHPRFIHWSRDSGQTRIMQDLGFLLAGRSIHEPAPALPGFCRAEKPVQPGAAFIGHLYQQDPVDYQHPALAALAKESVETWMIRGELPLWDVLARKIEMLPADLRSQLGLDRDQSFFWHFAYRLVVHEAQTTFRLNVLGAAAAPVVCYGNLRTGAPGVPPNLIAAPGHIPFGPALAETLSRHEVTIDVLNPGFVEGYSHKPILGFAAGGLMLINRKQDFIDAFGEAGEAVSYRSAADLAGLIDRFLGNPRFRAEVAGEIRARISARFQLRDVLARVLQSTFDIAGRYVSKPRRITRRQDLTHHLNLLPQMHSEPQWHGARVEHRWTGALVSTAPLAWMYAAAIDIPPVVKEMNEPHLRVTVIVEEGRIALATINNAGVIDNEQLISPTTHPVTVTIELPREEAATLMLRNTLDTASRALVLEAVLCDRNV